MSGVVHKKNRAFILAVISFVSGCTSIVDHSAGLEFKDVLGVKTLKVDAYLCQDESIHANSHGGN